MPHYFMSTDDYMIQESKEPCEIPFVRANELHSNDKEHLKRWALNILENELAHQMKWEKEVVQAIGTTRKNMHTINSW